MSAVETLSSLPSQFEAGVTLRFSGSSSSYPATEWTAVLVLNNGVDEPVSIAGTASGTGFVYVIPATQSFTPGLYQWAEYFTAISPTSEKARGETGTVEVLPNLSSKSIPSFAETMVLLLQKVLREFAGTTKVSVSFNGQSFSRANATDYQNQMVYWQSRVIAEKRKSDALRGVGTGGRIETSFVSSTTRLG